MKIRFRTRVEESGMKTPNAHSAVRRNVRPFQVHRPSPDGSTGIKIQREIWWFSLTGCTASNRPARRLPGVPARRPLGGLARHVFREGFGSQNCISNRFWPKNRSYSKQRIKPRLTGSRFARWDFRHLTCFAAQTSRKIPTKTAPASDTRRRESNPSTCLTKCKSR